MATLPLRLALIGFDYDAEGTDARRNTDKGNAGGDGEGKEGTRREMQWDEGKGLDDFRLRKMHKNMLTSSHGARYSLVCSARYIFQR